jgi:16S rRNA (guanine1516-N2)-methyltransferase
LRLIHLPETAAQAVAAQVWLAAQAQPIALSLSEQTATPTARELRLQPELTLICDLQGLWLAANGMKMQPDWIGELPRLQRAGARSEVLTRACLAAQAPQLIDATAGLGHDALLLAWCGAHVTLIERHPLLTLLLQSAQQQALNSADPRLRLAAARMTLIHASSEQYLSALIAQCDVPSLTEASAPIVDFGQGQRAMDSLHSAAQIDVIYLDPMFPKSARDKKQPLVKKEMQILQLLLHGNDSNPAHTLDLGDALLPLARALAPRVIVKRPKLAVPLAGVEPDHRWVGEACRYDGYFQQHAQSTLVEDAPST